MKKDILAAITFIMTGLLFHVVQTDQRVDAQVSYGIECEAAGHVVVGEFAPEESLDVTIQAEGLQDS